LDTINAKSDASGALVLKPGEVRRPPGQKSPTDKVLKGPCGKTLLIGAVEDANRYVARVQRKSSRRRTGCGDIARETRGIGHEGLGERTFRLPRVDVVGHEGQHPHREDEHAEDEDLTFPAALPQDLTPSPKRRRRWSLFVTHPSTLTEVAHGGGWGIRTPEGFHPTRFPSVRHRPLGESSKVIDATGPRRDRAPPIDLRGPLTWRHLAELPQGRNAARVRGLWRVREGSSHPRTAIRSRVD
jgi:hypothetical protein